LTKDSKRGILCEATILDSAYRRHSLEESGKTHFKLSRLVRTAASEIYVIWDGETRVGQVHLHYAHDTIHASLLLEVDLTVTEEEDLLEAIDEDIVSSYLPSFEREDLLVTVFRAEEISSFSYASPDMEGFGPEDDEED
jgi:hypothetical protein